MGGTWELETDGTVLVSKSNTTGSKFNASIGSVVGEETHTLTVQEMPSHNHGKTPADTAIPKLEWTTTAANLYTLNNEQGYPIGELVAVGGNQPHNNIQPSKIVNRWHRTA